MRCRSCRVQCVEERIGIAEEEREGVAGLEGRVGEELGEELGAGLFGVVCS